MRDGEAALTPIQRRLMRGLAGIPGSGPKGTSCYRCSYLVERRDNRRHVDSWHCAKYQALTGHQGAAVNPMTPACSYFANKLDPSQTACGGSGCAQRGRGLP